MYKAVLRQGTKRRGEESSTFLWSKSRRAVDETNEERYRRTIGLDYIRSPRETISLKISTHGQNGRELAGSSHLPTEGITGQSTGKPRTREPYNVVATMCDAACVSRGWHQRRRLRDNILHKQRLYTYLTYPITPPDDECLQYWSNAGEERCRRQLTPTSNIYALLVYVAWWMLPVNES